MKKLLTTLAALALLPGAAFADGFGGRSHDLRDSDTYRGKYSQYHVVQAGDEAALAVITPSHEDREQRRLDEKNSGGGN